MNAIATIYRYYSSNGACASTTNHFPKQLHHGQKKRSRKFQCMTVAIVALVVPAALGKKVGNNSHHKLVVR